MDLTLISLLIFGFFSITFFLIFLFKNINKKSFVSDDGLVFDSKSEFDAYQILYEKTKSLFSIDNQNNPNITILGFEKSFLTKLTKEGFSDLNTLFTYRKQIKSLSDLIN